MIPRSHQHRPGPLRFPGNALVPGGLPGRSPECTRSCQGCPVLITCLRTEKKNAIFSEVKRIETANIVYEHVFLKQKGHIYHDYIMHISHRIHVWYIYPSLANVNGKCFPTITIHGGIFWDNSWDFYLLEDFEKNKWCWVLLDSSSMIPLIFAVNLSWCFSYPGPTVLVDLDSKV